MRTTTRGYGIAHQRLREKVSPSKSKRQMRFLFAKKGATWVRAHHFDKVKRGKRK